MISFPLISSCASSRRKVAALNYAEVAQQAVMEHTRRPVFGRVAM